eukprot:COSAG02_NODE_66964_length_254_cov_0.664516_1_plen_36_part_10
MLDPVGDEPSAGEMRRARLRRFLDFPLIERGTRNSQ